MEPNWDRHEKEIQSLKRRVAELESLCFAMSRRLDDQHRTITGMRIDDYLRNYQP